MLHFAIILLVGSLALDSSMQILKIPFPQTNLNQILPYSIIQLVTAEQPQQYRYYHIEINFTKGVSALISLSQGLISNTTAMDVNGYEFYVIKRFKLQKTYHHLILDTQNGQPNYLKIQVSKKCNYSIKITHSKFLPCAQGCLSQGVCDGRCQCNNAFIDEDCSTKGIAIGKNAITSFKKQYIYYIQNFTDRKMLLTILNKSRSQLNITAVVPGRVYLPSSNLNNFYLSTSKSKITIQIEFIPNNQIEPSKIIFWFQTPDEITVSMQDDDPSNNSFPVLYIILITVLGFIVIVFTIYLIYRRFYKPWKLRNTFIDIKSYYKSEPYVLDPETRCFCQSQIRNPFVSTSCGHIFHEVCLEKYLTTKKKNFSCPSCFRQLENVYKTRIQDQGGAEILRLDQQ